MLIHLLAVFDLLCDKNDPTKYTHLGRLRIYRMYEFSH
jgi:hypothetical protein